MSRARDIANQIDAGEVVSHIIPGVLYPAVDGKDINGTALSSYTYGDLHTATGVKYYYTNIKGSKPIKDPRIGAHFGSQRHKFKSLQLLEQETATHGKNVYSVDGREWLRFCGTYTEQNGANGHVFRVDTAGDFLEITGYFNQFNFLEPLYQSGSARNRWIMSVDGTATVTESSNPVSADNPLGNRYVDSASLRTFATGITQPRIVTIKMTENSNDTQNWMSGCELIAQDTTSTANRSKIQIPSQDVVSYGKKFNVSGTPHYNPFNGYTATSSFSSVVDVDTSLGLEAWKHTDNNYYPPVNGGRIVKWVDSSGVIKTSVTLMPPNATGIGSISSNPRDPNYGSWSSQYQPTFKNETERQLHEVAKTFHFRELGNGSANGGNGGSYPDPSTLVRTAGTHNTAFVMDDGLTSLSCFNMYDYADYGLRRNNAGDVYFTFIGTGLTIKGKTYTTTVAQNLPYGTHVFRQLANGSSGSGDGGDWFIDGVKVNTFSGASGTVNQLGDYGILELTIHQPKRPLIPEDACVLADYMLMANFVPQTNGDSPHISKGIRYCSASRDSFIDGNSATANKFFYNIVSGTGGFQVSLNQNGYTLSEGRIVGFGHAFGVNFMRDTDRMTDVQARLDGSNYTYNSSDIWDTDTIWDDTNGDGTLTKSGSTAQEVYGIKNQTLGLHTFGDKTTTDPSANKFNDWIGWQIANPIHTSHHYQSFETPFLHELIGGDRNMEQTNLVVSPDGKTWDEVTRDVSYMGPSVMLTSTNDNAYDSGVLVILDEHRGRVTNSDSTQGGRDMCNKNIAIAYDRFIILVDGTYDIVAQTITNVASWVARISINGQFVQSGHGGTGYETCTNFLRQRTLKRGDYIQLYGKWHSDKGTNLFTIRKTD